MTATPKTATGTWGEDTLALSTDTLALAMDTLALATDTLALATDTLVHHTRTHPRLAGVRAIARQLPSTCRAPRPK